jgi:hypothetical protein
MFYHNAFQRSFSHLFWFPAKFYAHPLRNLSMQRDYSAASFSCRRSTQTRLRHTTTIYKYETNSYQCVGCHAFRKNRR